MKNELNYDCTIQILQTATVLWRESRRFFRPFGITEAQFNILHLVGQSSGMSQRELSDLLVVDRSNVTLLLDRMSKQGLVSREDVPGDRRVYRIVLTKTGEQLWKKILPHYREATEGVAEGIPQKDVKLCFEVLKKIEQNAARFLDS
jgi:DNA-binding MarR family transcriptional regulator